MVSTRNNPGGDTPAATTLCQVSKRTPATRTKTNNKPAPLPMSTTAKNQKKQEVDCFGPADASASSPSQKQAARFTKADGSPAADTASCPADASTEHQRAQQLQHAPASDDTAGQPAAESTEHIVQDQKDGEGDLLPVEVLHHLQQLRHEQQQQQQCSLPGHTMQHRKQKRQRRDQRKKRKQQSGPVQVAVLSLLSRSGAEQQGSSAGRGMRHQLLESRLFRSPAML